MWARTVVVAQKGIQQRVEVFSSEDDEVVKHFVPQSPGESLDMGLHLVSSKGRAYVLYSLPTEVDFIPHVNIVTR